MKKQTNVFSKLSVSDMKAVKGGAMPPLFRWTCYLGGNPVPNICFAFNPETWCGYDANSCGTTGTCAGGGGCI